ILVEIYLTSYLEDTISLFDIIETELINFPQFAERVNMKVITGFNMYLSPKKKIIAKNGINEIIANKLQACTIDVIEDYRIYIPMLKCIQFDEYTKASLAKCSPSYEKDILECITSRGKQ
ncbi:hypothetical protein WA158_002244, partial [Blastocystis sp. Blastoise]